MALGSIPTPAVAPADPVEYPVCDHMGESSLQLYAVHILLGLLKDYFAALERPVFISGNQFFYYRRGDPTAVVAPDLYTIDGEDLPPWAVKNWKTWEHDGKAPTLALEIVSDEHRKDYDDRSLERYQQLGVRELIRYDPGSRGRKHRELFAQFVRDDRGQLTRRPSPGDRVRSASYDFWLVHHGQDILRLGVGPRGASLWPTAAERAAAAAAERDSAEARAAAEAARAAEAEEARAAEAARAAGAEAEVERLRAELAALRGR